MMKGNITNYQKRTVRFLLHILTCHSLQLQEET